MYSINCGFLNISNYSFTQGSISSVNGYQITPVPNNRIVSEYINFQNISMIKIALNSNYRIAIVQYGEGNNFVHGTDWASTYYTYPVTNKFATSIRFLISKTDNSAITPTEANSAINYIRIYKYDLTNLKQIKQNAINEQQIVEFTPNQEQARKYISSGYYFLNDNYEVIIEGDSNPSPVSIGFKIYDEAGDMIYYSETNTNPAYKFGLYIYKKYFPDGKYFSLMGYNRENTSTSLTTDMIEYANNNIKIKRIEGKVLNVITYNDLIKYKNPASSLIDNKFYADFQSNTRICTSDFYKNTGQLITLANRNFNFYVRFYDSNFDFVKDSAWNNRFIDTSLEEYPYFKIIARRTNDVDWTQATINEFLDVIKIDGQILTQFTINNTGALTELGTDIRCCTYKMYPINDAYIKINDFGYDVEITTYDKETKERITSYGWFTYTSDYGRTDKAIKLQNCYVRFVFAKQDHSETFSTEDYKDIRDKFLNGTLIEIIESIKPHSLGIEISNGYPLYYNNEINNTINTLCSKISPNSIVFGMITDLHDNDLDHYSESVKYQLQALRSIKERARLDFIICGGDLTDGGYNSKSKLLNKMTDHYQNFSKIGVVPLFIRGNHDDNSYYSLLPQNCILRNDFYSRLIMNSPDNIISSQKTYYYHDFDNNNLRVICLDFIDYPEQLNNQGQLIYHAVSGDGVWRGYSDNQINWFCSEALNTNKRIIITSHYSTNQKLMSSWEQSTEHNWNKISEAMIAYQNRQSYTFNGQSYNFSNKTGKILIQTTGHSHSFGALKENGIIWSTTGSASVDATNRTFDDTDYETMDSRSYNNITEAHFNIFVCNDNNVNIISFGQMGDLNFTI